MSFRIIQPTAHAPAVVAENAAVVMAGVGVLVVACVLAVTGYRVAQLLGLGAPFVWAIEMFVPPMTLIVR